MDRAECQEYYKQMMENDAADFYAPAEWYGECWQEGYSQAEKDLALTWEDMVTINTIGSEVIGEHLFDNWSERQVYEEVLRRFNEYKQKTKKP